MTVQTPSLSAPSARALAASLADRQERDAALVDDRALVAYEAKWKKALARLQRSHPSRWHVPGLSDDEVRDLLTLRLVEALRRADVAELNHEQRPERPWGLSLMLRELRALRRAFKLEVTTTDLRQVPLASRAATQEEQLLSSEEERERALAQADAEGELSRPQRRWLAAFKLSARSGGFFESSAEPNLSAASRVLGKDRSSAQRAYRELQTRFAAARAKRS